MKKKIKELKIFVSLVYIFFFTFFNLINFNSAYALDAYSASGPLKDIINKKDYTTYKGIKFIKKEKKKTVDGRLGDHSKKYEAIFYIFEAEYSNNDNIKIFVNSEFGNNEKIAKEAIKYSKMLGQVPNYLRKELQWVIIHGPWIDKAKCTCMWYAIRNKGIYIHTEMVPEQQQQEVLIHELAHVTIDSLYYNSANQPVWQQAQKKDLNYISGYAKKKPNVEDIAESVVAWVAVRCKKNRISKSIYKSIINSIPNRLNILDNLIFNNSLHPLTCKK